jgi:RNA polymerase sigma-70 factor, ECF subfamily
MPKSAQTGYAVTAVTLYERSGAAAYGMSAERFAAILEEISGRHLSREAASESGDRSSRTATEVTGVTSEQRAEFCAGLRLEELALARACAAGNERAWQDFISRYRQKLHGMALHITRDAAHAAELADSLFADLYGVNTPEDRRKSKLLSYTGRGSLEGWLRTVMAQEFINRYRKQKRTVSLEEQTEQGAQFVAAQEPAGGADRISQLRLEAATNEALAELSAEDRFTLASYYLDGRTLAEIAAMLGLHESSVSRRLDRLASGLRKRILAGLRTQGMSHAQAAEALETDVRDLQLNLHSRLTQDSEVKTFVGSRRIPAQDLGERGTD